MQQSTTHLPKHGGWVGPFWVMCDPRGVNSAVWQNERSQKADAPEKAQDYHGACGFGRVSPDVASKGVKSLNIEVPFEEALKLRLALDSCLHALNRYNRSTQKGRAMGVLLSVKTESLSIAVIEAAMPSFPLQVDDSGCRALLAFEPPAPFLRDR